MLHRFKTSIANIPLPERFTYPFCYTPHPLCVMAAEEVQHYLNRQHEWKEELSRGKMFGVLVVQTGNGEIGYLAAFSGILAGTNQHSYFVPPVYDLLQPQGFSKRKTSPPSTGASSNWKRTRNTLLCCPSSPGPTNKPGKHWT